MVNRHLLLATVLLFGLAAIPALWRESEKPLRPDVVFIPTPQTVVEQMLELAKVSRDDVVYDLGCGDGRILITAAKKYGCRGVGYDVDPRRVKESRENAEKSGVGHLVRIEQQDIFTVDLDEATVVTLYLLTRLNVKLIPQLEQLAPGSRIVSYTFGMQGLIEPDKVVTFAPEKGGLKHTIYLWTTPLKRHREPVSRKKV